ncbi:efflux RND transporter periplasmic adaptor subunit [bacterium]|nr:efflux RND transporter periplasmic adaptor subunit [bacterium]
MNAAKLIVAGLLVLGAAAAGRFAWQGYLASQAPAQLTAGVSRGDVEETVLATGTLKPARLVAVGAQASGRITAVKVRLGETVRSGELIAEIDSVTQQNNLRTAEAELANVKAQLAEKQVTLVLNQRNLARQKEMVAKHAVSQSDHDGAEADLNVTRAQIEALQAQIDAAEVAVEAARVNLGYTRITAPIDGAVLQIVSQEGQTVNAAQSTPTIVILGQLDTMTVRTEISEADITRVEPGLPVYFTILGDADRRYDAKLESIEPAPESVRNDSSFSSASSSASSSSSSSSSSSEAIYYNGVFDVPNPDGRLRTYMTAQVHIVLGRARNVLTVPAAALGAKGADGRYAVRVVGADGAVSERTVAIGLNDKVTAEIRDGLAEGEIVVMGEAAGQASSGGSGGPGMSPMGF